VVDGDLWLKGLSGSAGAIGMAGPSTVLRFAQDDRVGVGWSCELEFAAFGARHSEALTADPSSGMTEKKQGQRQKQRPGAEAPFCLA